MLALGLYAFLCVSIKQKRARTKNGAARKAPHKQVRKGEIHFMCEWLLAVAAMMAGNMQISDTGRRYCNPYVSRCFGNDKWFCDLRAVPFFEEFCCSVVQRVCHRHPHSWEI